MVRVVAVDFCSWGLSWIDYIDIVWGGKGIHVLAQSELLGTRPWRPGLPGGRCWCIGAGRAGRCCGWYRRRGTWNTTGWCVRGQDEGLIVGKDGGLLTLSLPG